MATASTPPTDPLTAEVLAVLEPLWTAPLSDSALEHTRLMLADYVGVALAGSGDAAYRRLVDAVLGSAQPGACAVFGLETRHDPATAAFLNSSAGTILELDDRLPEVRLHPGIHVAASCLAVAEAEGRSGPALLRSVLVGYEAAAVLGRLFRSRSRPTWLHPHGYLSTLAAAVGVASLRGLPLERVPDVLSCAAMVTALPLASAGDEGATVANVYSGFACTTALRVVDCVAGGITGPASGLSWLRERVPSSETADRPRPAGLAVERAEVKQIPCCAAFHPYLLALRELRAAEPPRPVAERIRVAGPRTLARYMQPEPVNRLAAQFSLPYTIAYEWLRGLDFDAPLEPDDEAVRALARRVELEVAPESPRVVVVAGDGQPRAAAVRGEPLWLPDEATVAAKLFRLNAERREQAERLWAYLQRLDEAPSVRLPLSAGG